MSTFQEMRLEIADHLDDDAIDDQIGKAINRAIRYYAAKKFYFNQTTFTFNTVAAQEFYDLVDAPDIDTFLEVTSQYLTSNSLRYPINVTEYDTIDRQNGAVTAMPTNWAYFAKKFRLYPIPDAAYVVTVAGHYRLAAFELDGSDDNTTNVWTTDAEDLIQARAEKLLAIHVTNSPEWAVAAQSLEAEALECLLLETQHRRGRPLLQLDPALTSCEPFNIRTGV